MTGTTRDRKRSPSIWSTNASFLRERFGLLLALIGLPLLAAGCQSEPMAGTGSQTGNSVVAGRVLASAPDSSTAPIEVFLRPLRWTRGQSVAAGELQHTTTDASGNYRFVDVPPNLYRIEAVRDELAWSRTIRALCDTNHAPTGRLAAKGRVVVELLFTEAIRGGRIEFYGLDRALDIPDTSASELRLTIEGLPVGLQTLRVYLPDQAKVYCQTPVRIGPDSTSRTCT